MKALTALTLSICLSALCLLAGCGLERSKPPLPSLQPALVIDNPVPAYVPVDSKLTAKIADPAPPPSHCVFKDQPAVCVLDGLLQIPAWAAALEQANLDRSITAITAPAVTAPAKPKP